MVISYFKRCHYRGAKNCLVLTSNHYKQFCCDGRQSALNSPTRPKNFLNAVGNCLMTLENVSERTLQSVSGKITDYIKPDGARLPIQPMQFSKM